MEGAAAWKVRIFIPEIDPADIDSICLFVGTFARKAFEQGWPDEEMERVIGPVTARRALEELGPYVEHFESEEPEHWLNHSAYRRLADYRVGYRIMSHDPDVKPSMLRWYLQVWREAWSESVRTLRGES